MLFPAGEARLPGSSAEELGWVTGIPAKRPAGAGEFRQRPSTSRLVLSSREVPSYPTPNGLIVIAALIAIYRPAMSRGAGGCGVADLIARSCDSSYFAMSFGTALRALKQ